MEQGLTYERAFEELTAISREIESGSVSVDLLAEKVKRASELIRYCQQRLHDTEAEVAKVIGSMGPDDGEGEEA